MTYQDTRSLPELVGSLATESSELIRKEIELARAELTEKLSQLMSGGQTLVMGAVLGLGALGAILVAISMAIALCFEIWVGLGTTAANSVGFAIVGIIVGIIGVTMLSSGRAALKASNLQLDRTTSSLERDAAIVKEKL
jgi:hypothetical protein